MSQKSRVAVLRTTPETVLADYARLFELAGAAAALAPGVPTILKDNISWHYPMPSANTTPWQLEGAILALHAAGFTDLRCVENQTVVTNPFKGDRLNGYDRIFQGYHVPVLYNFHPNEIQWVPYTPKAKMLVLNEIYPEGIHLPDYFFGKNIDIAAAVTWAMLGNFLGLGFAALSDIWINGYSPAVAVVGEFLPAAGPNMVFAAILVPLLVAAYASVQRQSGR